MIEEIIGKKAVIDYKEQQKGDMKNTYADISKAKKMLGYLPEVKLNDGLKMEIEWIKKIIEKDDER